MAAVSRRVVILTGLSGAGVSTALKALEDVGYEAVDNLRLSLIPTLIEATAETARPLAISVDCRTADFDRARLLECWQDVLAHDELEPTLLFLDCSDEVLQRRFTETRRRHPMAADRLVVDGIRRERDLLWPLRQESDLLLDTSGLFAHDLKRWIEGNFALSDKSTLNIAVVSFGYRFGLPREADLVFDVRFLRNPHYDPLLRPLSGLDAPVADHVREDAGYADVMDKIQALLLELLPRYQAEGKHYLTIAIGCTGGRHRSVTVASDLNAWLAARGANLVGLVHRDIGWENRPVKSGEMRKI